MTRFLQFTSATVAIALLTVTQPGETLAEVSPGAYVVAVNNPLTYFAERLAGDAIDVRLPVPAGTDPAFWQPTVEDILMLQSAERILLNGAGYSPWLDKVAVSRRTLVVTSNEESWIPLKNQVTHSHGPQGEHAHGSYAGTTWMDLELAASQAGSVAAALATLLPDHTAKITGRLGELQQELFELDSGLQLCAAQLAGRQVIYSHPVYQYFERRYLLAGTSLHWEPDIMPTEEQWTTLGNMLGKQALFVWEAAPGEDIIAKLASMQLPFVTVNPAANRGEQDWLAVQRSNLARLEQHCGG